MIDLPALQSATKTCEKSLLKYLSFPGVDNSYCDRISALLDNAEAWGSHIVQAYTKAEVHSIKGSPGDVANVGVFLIMRTKLFLSSWNHLSLGTLIGEIIVNAPANYLITCLMISRIN